MKKIRKLTSFVLAILVLVLALATTVFAEDSNVTYTGNSGEFVFMPGSDYSPTDLFSNFKGVMPGASVEQKITVKNNANNKVKVTIYLRSLGETEGSSEDFLEQLKLTVKTASISDLFDAPANETAGLTDWVELGTLHAGGQIDLNLVLTVPTTLDNDYQNQIGKIKWQFMVVETPEENKPTTGDSSNIIIWIIVIAVAVACIIFVLILLKKKKKRDEE